MAPGNEDNCPLRGYTNDTSLMTEKCHRKSMSSPVPAPSQSLFFSHPPLPPINSCSSLSGSSESSSVSSLTRRLSLRRRSSLKKYPRQDSPTRLHANKISRSSSLSVAETPTTDLSKLGYRLNEPLSPKNLGNEVRRRQVMVPSYTLWNGGSSTRPLFSGNTSDSSGIAVPDLQSCFSLTSPSNAIPFTSTLRRPMGPLLAASLTSSSQPDFREFQF